MRQLIVTYMEIISTPPLSALENMEHSWHLLNSLKENPRCILHFYNWQKPCATYGYFTKPNQFLDLKELEKQGIELARRPTGGGILFHLTDLAFSFFLPANHPRYSINTMENYQTVNQAILDGMQKWIDHGELLKTDPFSGDNVSKHFCMAKPTRFDVMINGQKVAGGAQRRLQWGLLHQGSIHLKSLAPDLLDKILLPGTCVIKAMQKNSAVDLCIDPEDLRNSLQNSFKAGFLVG